MYVLSVVTLSDLLFSSNTALNQMAMFDFMENEKKILNDPTL